MDPDTNLSPHLENNSAMSNDLGTWKKIDRLLRDLLVERDPSRVVKNNSFCFPK